MNFIYAFLLGGIVCLIAQIILDNTKLSAGHITSLFTVIGVFLSFLGVYDILLEYSGSGASVLICNFGHILYKGGLYGYYENGFVGIFMGLLKNSSAIIVAAIVFAFLFSILFKPRD